MRLFIHNSRSPFVMRDRAILAGHGPVNRFYYLPSTGMLRNFLQQLRLLIWLLYWSPRSEGTYIWFADYHSLLPVLFARAFRKPVWVVLGGYDTAKLPEYRYGSFAKPLRAFFAYWTIRLATVCLAVSEYTRAEALKRCSHARVEVVYNGADLPNCPQDKNDRNLVATIAVVDRPGRIPVKGIDRFIEIARRLPDLRFVLVGVEERCRKLLPILPANVEIKPPMSVEALYRFLHKVRVYCQFSRVESFGLAAVEATACGAVPVITPVGALPEVLGNCALVWNGNSPEEGAGIVRKAMSTIVDPAQVAALRDKFSLHRRRHQITRVLLENA